MSRGDCILLGACPLTRLSLDQDFLFLDFTVIGSMGQRLILGGPTLPRSPHAARCPYAQTLIQLSTSIFRWSSQLEVGGATS